MRLRAPQVRNLADVQLDLEQLATTAPFTGSGDPNGVVSAPTGSLYTSRTGGAGATLWAKESSPTPSTGWVAK